MTHDPHKDDQIEARFWTEIRKDMTVMLGLGSEIEYRPMTAQLATDDDHGPFWFFGNRETDLVRHLDGGAQEASFHFVSRGYDIWATVSGTMQIDMNRGMINKLWNPHVSAWYEGGKDDPKLALLRMDPAHAKIWKDGNSLVAYALKLFGHDPAKDYEANTASVSLR